MDRMRELNIDWVCLIVTVLQDTFASTRQYRDFTITPADDEVRDIVDYIHSKGMKVQLRPMLECWDGTQRMSVHFPEEGIIIPGKPVTHWSQWFDGLTARTLHYARLAERGGCEAYGLDSELDRTTHQQAHWLRVVAAARSVFQRTPYHEPHRRRGFHQRTHRASRSLVPYVGFCWYQFLRTPCEGSWSKSRRDAEKHRSTSRLVPPGRRVIG